MFKDSPAFSGFSTNDVATAKKFYEDTLGLEVEDRMGGLALHLKGQEVFIYPKGETHQPASFTVLNFVVEDIDAAADQLTAKGIKLEQYEGMHQDEKGVARGKSVNMGPNIVWFKDPAGNVLSALEN